MESSESIVSQQSNSQQTDSNMSTRLWLIIIGTGVGTIIEGIVPHSFGTLIANFKSVSNSTLDTSFNMASQFQLNWIPALSSALPCIFLPFFAIFVQNFKRFYQVVSGVGFIILAISCYFSSLATLWETLLFTHSVLYSVGTSLVLVVIIVITAEYFPIKHRFHVLATSFYQIGYPVSALIGNPILAVLIVNLGWRNSLRLVSMLEIVGGIIIAVIMVPAHNKGYFKCSNENPDEIPLYLDTVSISEDYKLFSSKSLKHFIKTHQIWPWLFAKYFNYLCWYGFRTNIVTYLVKSTNFGLKNSAALMSSYAGAEIAVAIIASIVGDKLRGWLVHIHIIAAILLAVLTGIYPRVLTSYLSAVFLMIGIGISIQLSLSFGYPASIEVWNSKSDMKTGWILTNVAAGLGIVSSPLCSGILMDYFGIASLFSAQTCGWVLQVLLYSTTLLVMKIPKPSEHSEYENIPLSN